MLKSYISKLIVASLSFLTELQKIVGERLLQKEEQSRASVVHLMESHSVGLRHAAVNAHRDKLLKRKRALNQMKNGTQPPNEIHEMPQPPNSKEMEMCMEFGKPSFPHWLENLPEEWTVVHITVNFQAFYFPYSFLC